VSRVVRTFEATAGIYALIDPRTDRTMYVGQAIDIEYRYRQHCSNNSPYRQSNMDKYHWIEELKSLGLVPKLVVLEECNWPESDEVEKRLIREHKARGECELNRAVGGQGAVIRRSQNGHKDDWFQLGREIKETRERLMHIVTESCRLAGGGRADEWAKVVSYLDRAKARLEAVLHKTFPEWENFTRVFYGAIEDDGEDKD
jgi:hypothetical protein